MRINLFQKELTKKNIDLTIIFSLDEKPNTNVVYFSGYVGIGLLAILKSASFLLVPEMEYEKAKSSLKEKKIKIFKTDKKKKILESLSLLLRKQKNLIEKVGIEEDNCSVAIYKKLRKTFKAKYCDVSEICSGLRKIKDNEEIKKINEACRITDYIFKKIVTKFNFKEENEIKKFIEEETIKNNCELAFPPIVASARGSGQPHYNASNKIKKGFLMLDFGVKYDGYCSDMTRMLYLGTPSKKELNDFDLVLKTCLGCEKAVMKKKKFSQLYLLSLKILDKKAVFFTHSLGHGLGLDIHESPSLSKEDKNKIEENIVFTIEPGIYFSNKYGIRIEDTLIIKNKKIEILTKSKKELNIIKNKK